MPRYSSAPSAPEPRKEHSRELNRRPLFTVFSAPRRLGGEFQFFSASPRLRVKKEPTLA